MELNSLKVCSCFREPLKLEKRLSIPSQREMAMALANRDGILL
jgi:hypothetical protein